MTGIIYVGDLCSVPLGSVHLGERRKRKEKRDGPTPSHTTFYNHWRPQIIQYRYWRRDLFCVCRLAEVGVLEPPREQGKAYETGQVRAAFSLNIHWVHSSHNLYNAQQSFKLFTEYSLSATVKTCATLNSQNLHNTRQSKPVQHSTVKTCTTLNSQNLYNTQQSRPAQHLTVKTCTTLHSQNLHHTQQSKPSQPSLLKTCTTLNS